MNIIYIILEYITSKKYIFWSWNTIFFLKYNCSFWNTNIDCHYDYKFVWFDEGNTNFVGIFKKNICFWKIYQPMLYSFWMNKSLHKYIDTNNFKSISYTYWNEYKLIKKYKYHYTNPNMKIIMNTNTHMITIEMNTINYFWNCNWWKFLVICSFKIFSRDFLT